MENKYIIREIRESDSSQMAELEKDFLLLMDSFVKDEDCAYSAHYYDTDAYKDYVYAFIKEQPMYVVENENEIIGFFEIYFEEDAKTCNILKIYVTSENRKSGIGKSIINDITQKAKMKNCNVIVAEVILGNEVAKEFFNYLLLENISIKVLNI